MRCLQIYIGLAIAWLAWRLAARAGAWLAPRLRSRFACRVSSERRRRLGELVDDRSLFRASQPGTPSYHRPIIFGGRPIGRALQRFKRRMVG